MVFICISLMSNDNVHHFLCLLAIWISFSMKCLFTSFRQFLLVFFLFVCVFGEKVVFLVLNCKISLYIPGTSFLSLSCMCFAAVSPQYQTCFFSLIPLLCMWDHRIVSHCSRVLCSLFFFFPLPLCLPAWLIYVHLFKFIDSYLSYSSCPYCWWMQLRN